MARTRKVAAATLAVAFAASCGSGSSTPEAPRGDDAFRARCGTARPPSTPPPRTTTVTGGGATRWFVLDRLSLGLTDLRSAQPSDSAWRCYGFDLDGRTTTATQSKTGESSCRRAPGASSAALADGAGGIDNAFGKTVLPVLRAVDRCLSDAASDWGQLALYLRVDGVGEGDTAHAPGALYLAQSSGAARGEAQSEIPIALFADGYVAEGVWVSGAPPSSVVDVPLQVGFDFELDERKGADCPRKSELRLPLTNVVLTVGVDGTNGVLAGVTSAEGLGDAVRSWLSDFGICGRSADAVASTVVAESSDLVLGAPQHQDPARTCDAVSFGAAFTLKAASDPGASAALPARTNACKP